MKTSILTIVFIAFALTIYSQEKGASETYEFGSANKETTESSSEEMVHSFVEEDAYYPGGNREMMQFITTNLIYPKSALKSEIEGKVVVRFIVEKDGSLSNFKIVKNIEGCPECSEEVIRILKLMPKWTPSKNGGKPVRAYFSLPVVFKLTEKKIGK